MKGQCLCGSVEFEIDIEELKLYRCFCSLCRKQSGTSSNAATIVKEEQFRFIRGKNRVSSWKKESGYRSDFCSNCGSPVPNPLGDSGYYWIPAGLLEGQNLKTSLVAHFHLDSAISWRAISDADVHFQELPSLAEIIKILE